MSTEVKIPSLDEFEDEDKSRYYFYYDSHPTKEDLMGEVSIHDRVSEDVRDTVRLMYPDNENFVGRNLNIYQTANPKEYPVAPDVCLIKGIAWHNTRSWYLKNAPGGEGKPAPSVVFEIASDETWKKDLDQKPRKYASFGVKEYFAYDPREQKERRRIKRPRLHGWRLVINGKRAEMQPIPDDDRGWKWSEELQSWLQPDGEVLRFRTADGQLRLTVEEHERTERLRAEAQRDQVLAERDQVLAEKDQVLAERDQLALMNEKLLQKLRELKIDPNDL